MTPTLGELIQNGESDRLEFKKRPNDDVKKYLKTVVAFSNCCGGSILFGVDEDGQVSGLEGDLFRTMDELTDRISSEITPQVSMSPRIASVNGRDIIEIRIEPGIHRPYYLMKEGEKNGTYVRINATTCRCDEETLTDLRLQGCFRSADTLEVTGDLVTPDDGRVETLRRVYRDHGCRTPDIEHMANIGLLKRHDDGFTATVGFNLLTRNTFPFARLECARFKGTEKGTYSNKKTCSGSIIDQIDCAMAFIDNNLLTDVTYRGVRRVESLEIPTDALREYVTNALAHRSYSITTLPVFIAVYDDRVEIESPGSIPFGLSSEDICRGVSRPRNPALCTTLREIGLMEGWGGGIIRANNLCTEAGLEMPEVSETDGRVKVTIYRRCHRTPVANDAPISDNESEVIRLLEKDPTYTIDEISEISGIPRSSVYVAVTSLKRRGVLRRQGSRKTGTWMLDLPELCEKEGPEGPL